ncbi:MAG: hypothetical protein CM1200mP13_07070 [Candidatus Pelagibacterales bacterium]|nr:MAG: hypothetical protein CM1200mP13_07070 [Pelagibacterales bacterium]
MEQKHLDLLALKLLHKTPFANWSSTWLIGALELTFLRGATKTKSTPNFAASSLAPFSTDAQKGLPDPGPLS